MTKLVVEPLDIPDVKLVRPPIFKDARGFFSELYNARALAAAGIDAVFVQDNCSLSAEAGTVRGLHFQLPPAAQAKLVRVEKGAVFDAFVDLRRGSPSYRRVGWQVLRAQDWAQLFIPRGFAHGLCTLEPETVVHYKVDAPYSADLDRGMLWNDPELAIPWPALAEAAIVSDKDRRQPRMAELLSELPF